MFKPAHSNRTPTTSASAQKTRSIYSKHPSILDLYNTILPSVVGLLNDVSKRRPQPHSSDGSSCTAYLLTVDWLHCFCRSAILAVARLSGTYYSDVNDLSETCSYDNVYSLLTTSLPMLLFLSLTYGRFTQDARRITLFWIFRASTKNFLYKWCYLWSRIAGEQWWLKRRGLYSTKRRCYEQSLRQLGIWV